VAASTVLLSYPINFFIYCGMSQQFRDTFCGLFTSCSAGVQAPQAETVIEDDSPPAGTKTTHDAGQHTYIKLVPGDEQARDAEPARRDADPVANEAV